MIAVQHRANPRVQLFFNEPLIHHTRLGCGIVRLHSGTLNQTHYKAAGCHILFTGDREAGGRLTDSVHQSGTAAKPP
jgi:hypothetical protein